MGIKGRCLREYRLLYFKIIQQQTKLKMKLSLAVIGLASFAAAERKGKGQACDYGVDTCKNDNGLKFTCQTVGGAGYSCQPKFYYDEGMVCKSNGAYNDRQCASGMDCIDVEGDSNKGKCQKPSNSVIPGAECKPSEDKCSRKDGLEFTCQSVGGAGYSCQPKYYYDEGIVLFYIVNW